MTSWERSQEALWRRSGERRILMGPINDEILVLEGTGRVIWDLLDQPCTQERLFDVLSEVFGGERSRIEVELLAFLEELEAVGGVVRR